MSYVLRVPGLRIAQLVENLELGGLERMAVDLAAVQRQAGHSVSVYCLHGDGPLAGKVREAGIPVVAFRKPPGFSAGVIRSLAAQLRRDRVDVLHGHNPGVHHYAAIAARLGGVPVCINTRHSALSSSGVPYQERYFRLVAPFTSAVVFVCDFVRRQLEDRIRYAPRKSSVILNGIPLDPFRAAAASPGSCPSRLRFGTVGRLVPAKGHSILLQAFSRLAGRLPSAELRIFGSGPLHQALAGQIVQLGLQGRVFLEGHTGDPAAAMRDFDLFVFSSVTEGLPLVILEAMASGLPVVTTDVGGIPEIVPAGSSWLCPPGDPDALAAALWAASQADDLRSRGEAARSIAFARHGVEAMHAEYNHLYTRLLAGR